MPEDHSADGRLELRSRLHSLRASRSQWNAVISQIGACVWRVGGRLSIFGGFLRDLLLREARFVPRDLDLVVGQIDDRCLAEIVRPFLVRRTRFGGYQLLLDGRRVDIWSLEHTWAFVMGLVRPASFAELPLTTFLNIEAVVAEVGEQGIGEVWEEGFFRAIDTRILNVNLAENPYPALCVVRSLVVAKKFQMSIERNLAEYIVRYADILHPDEFMFVQKMHYGSVRQSRLAIEEAVRLLRIKLKGATWKPVQLR